MPTRIDSGAITVAFLLLCGCGSGTPPTYSPPATGPAADTATGVNRARLAAAGDEPRNWLTHGRTYDEQRHSPLDQIDRENIDTLGLGWYFDVPTKRGMEATPLIVDGRMFVTGSWSLVYALDAATGEQIWRYDPGVPRDWSRYACCDAVNRGVAAWGDSVFVGTLDGWLVALDAATGQVRWRVDTIDRQPPYTITGAPRVIDGLVIIGNGGAEFGVRGYVTAYDAATGTQRWRFHTVPGNPQRGFENDAMKMAAATWTGEWWRYGGGGTVWDAMAYDPELGLLYIGVGNGSPWNRRIRSPDGGDNLFLSSIVALRPETGEYVWHYQTTPGDTWDYTATQHMILADLKIDGEMRKVLIQAPKNGFFYVLDRTDGSLIGAEPYVQVNWASHVDPVTGRPVEVEGARYADQPFLIMPSSFGGHNWHPMAFSPTTGLVYVPAQDIPFVHGNDPDFEFTPNAWNTGTNLELAAFPDDPATAAAVAQTIRGQLIAWDPVTQREAWRYQHAGPWNGGVLSTAGDLVFQGSLIGEFAAYDAHSGERLWQFDARTGIAAAPVSYAVEDVQHVAVAVGWGTVFALAGGPGTAALGLQNVSRILSFRLDGDASLPPAPAATPTVVPKPPPRVTDATTLAAGKDLYYQRCWVCHGDAAVSGGVVADLRHSDAATHAQWDAIVLGGLRRAQGMPAFADILDKQDSDAIHAWIIERAWLAYEDQ